ncbi:short-chain dehydrogenase [Acetobacter pasteurianus]|uniref:SDR family NAD(P)-dependent oxidoreductase n=1 Tax=Acetobacter pasteurianus TaxID=438 RepID=UPI0022BE540B|nr:SDR family NAD(P)-dependent oxidoreductase [Acetobacter pasteurianus]GLH30372.1 short-chain dehydrogenase [Acetobacter pasteurianus]
MTDIRGKVVWVVGASRGIGQAVAIASSKYRPKKIIISGRDKDLLNITAQKTGSVPTTICPLDVTSRVSIDTAIANIFGNKESENLDIILVYSSGVSQRSLALDTNLSVTRSLMEVNFFGLLEIMDSIKECAGILPVHLVVMSSLVGKFGTSERSSYSASKHALHGYLESMRAETRKKPFKITIVCPGYVNTGITLRSLTANGDKFNVIEERIKRGMSPEVCGKKICRAITHNRPEIIIGGFERFAVPISRYFPSLFRFLVP